MRYIPVTFSLTPEQNRWIEIEAFKRVQGTVLPVNKSVIIREAVESYRKECEKPHRKENDYDSDTESRNNA